MSEREHKTYINGRIKPQKTYEIVRTNELQENVSVNGNLLITLRVTEACDLKCRYCFWNDGKHYDYDTIIKSIDQLYLFMQKSRTTSVRFFYHGGEATRHPHIVDILKHIKQKQEETGIISFNEMQTNLTVNTKKLRDILEYSDQLNITFHFTELKNKQHKLKHFNQNWQYLVDNNIKIHNFDIMMEPIPTEQLPEMYALIEDYLKYSNIENSEMIYEFGYKFENHESYNEQTLQQHKEFYLRYNKTDQLYKVDGKTYTTNDFWREGLDCRGWHCNAGITSFTVNGDGNVFNCGIHMTEYTSNPKLETPYTNLVTDKLAVTKLVVLNTSGTICRWGYCGGDYYISRRKMK